MTKPSVHRSALWTLDHALGGLAAAVVAVLLVAPEAWACGDKFLVIGRGVRSQRARGAVQKASILMYLDPQSELPEALREEHFEQDLKFVGHSVRSVASQDEAAQALRSGRYDLVLAGISDMTALEPVVGSVANRPTLLPIIYNPTGEELTAARKQFRCVMKSPSTRRDFLVVIDDAMVLRKKSDQTKGQ